MKFKMTVLLVLTLFVNLVNATNTIDLVKKTELWNQNNPFSLPHWMTPDELSRRSEIGRNRIITDPPMAPVRQLAEFDPMTGVMIRYPFGIPMSLIIELSMDIRVITIVSSQSQANTVLNQYNSAGVNTDNCEFMIAPTDSYWTRDYGPWFIFDGNNEMGTMDYIYNRPRPNDDMVTSRYATYDTLNCFGMNLEHTGGNYMCDGLGVAASTHIVYTENTNYTHQEINDMLLNYCGINTYYVVQDPNNTYIDHIDCWGKFLAPDKMLIRSVPTTHPQYNQIESLVTFFSSQISSWGTPYQIYRVNTPSNQPYTNSLILNKKVFVPKTGNANMDNAALAVYQAAMPGYEIIGFTGLGSAPWESTDALHCRTHELGDRGQLYINHIPLLPEQTIADGYPINAYVYCYSGAQLYSDSLKVVYKINNGEYTAIPMTMVTENNYQAIIPAQAPGTQVAYYIHAADLSGRSENHPYIGAPDPHVFTIVVPADTTAPVISFTPPENFIVGEFPAPLAVMVTDNVMVGSVYMEYKVNSGSLNTLNFNGMGMNLYTLMYSSIASDGDTITYRIVANDTATPANVTSFPDTTWLTARFYVSNQDNVANANFLFKNYPNPFHAGSQTKVEFFLNDTKNPKLEIFNIKGQLIQSYRLNSAKGYNSVVWNGKDRQNKNCAAGVYFLRLKTDKIEQVRKTVIIQ